MRLASDSAGNGTKCMTMPEANHIANSGQNATPNQRCSVASTRISPLRRGAQLERPGRAEDNLVGQAGIGKLSIERVGYIAHAEAHAHLLQSLPWQVPTRNVDKGEQVGRGV